MDIVGWMIVACAVALLGCIISDVMDRRRIKRRNLLPRPYKLVLGLMLLLSGLAGAETFVGCEDKDTSCVFMNTVKPDYKWPVIPIPVTRHDQFCLAKMREAMKRLQDADFVVSTEKHRITKEIHLGVANLQEALDIKHRWDQTMRECVQEGNP